MTEPCVAPVTVSAVVPARHLCPYRPEVDLGEVEVSWRVDGSTLELHALVAAVAALSDQEIGHEEFTAAVADRLRDLPGLRDLTVTSRWVTGDARVTVRALDEDGDGPVTYSRTRDSDDPEPTDARCVRDRDGDRPPDSGETPARSADPEVAVLRAELGALRAEVAAVTQGLYTLVDRIAGRAP